jgi:hypothetical protein
MESYHPIEKKEFIILRNYIRSQGKPSEFMRILQHISKYAADSMKEVSYAVQIKNEIEKMEKIMKQVDASLINNSFPVFEVLKYSEQLHKLVKEMTHECGLKEAWCAYDAVEIFSNPNVDVKFFEEHKQYLEESELQKILSANINLWRDEDLPPVIKWPIQTYFHLDFCDLTFLEEYVLSGNVNHKGLFELNREITIEFVKKIINHRMARDICDFQRLAGNECLNEDDLLDIACDYFGELVSAEKITQQNAEIMRDEMFIGLMHNPNLTLEGFITTNNVEYYDFDEFFPLIWSNKFHWCIGQQHRNYLRDIVARRALIEGFFDTFMPFNFSKNLLLYVDYA